MAKGVATAKRGTIEVQSRLRMFLSLDIVGSTEFKQAKRGVETAEGADSWVEPFLSFYQIAVQQMAVQWAAVRESIAAVGRGDRASASSSATDRCSGRESATRCCSPRSCARRSTRWRRCRR